MYAHSCAAQSVLSLPFACDIGIIRVNVRADSALNFITHTTRTTGNDLADASSPD